jgi:hypothetical protein
MTAHPAARSREMVARVPAQETPAPSDWMSAVEVLWAAKDIRRAVGSVVILAKTAAQLLARVASLTVFARFCRGGAGCGDSAGNDGVGCSDSAKYGGPAAVIVPAMTGPAAVIAPAMGGAGCSDSAGNGGAGCGDWQSSEGGGASCGDMDSAVGDGRVLAGGTACSVVAGSAVAEFSSAVDGVWRRGCEQCSLLSAHASLLLLSHARLLSLAWRPGLHFTGGAAVVGAGAGGILQTMVSFSRPSHTSYNTLAQPLLSTHGIDPGGGR